MIASEKLKLKLPLLQEHLLSEMERTSSFFRFPKEFCHLRFIDDIVGNLLASEPEINWADIKIRIKPNACCLDNKIHLPFVLMGIIQRVVLTEIDFCKLLSSSQIQNEAEDMLDEVEP